MYRGLLGVALLMGAAPAMAGTYYAKVNGVVTEEAATLFTTSGATSPIKVGDMITATFTSMTPDSVGTMMSTRWGGTISPKVTFQIGDFTWTSRGDFAASFEPVTFDAGPDPLAGYYSTMDDAVGGGDLHVDGYTFEIGEFGYDLYTGPGFKGVFDRLSLEAYRNGVRLPSPYGQADYFAVAPVPEPAAWAMMIAGFGLAGAAIRGRRLAVATRLA